LNYSDSHPGILLFVSFSITLTRDNLRPNASPKPSIRCYLSLSDMIFSRYSISTTPVLLIQPKLLT